MRSTELDNSSVSSHRVGRVSRRAWTALVVVCAVAIATVGPVGGAPSSLAAAEARLERATAERVVYDAALRDAQAHYDELSDEIDALGALDAQLADDLAAARRELREFAVEAYIDGGRSEIYRATLDIEQAQALSWQSSIASGQSTAADAAAEKFEVLKEATTPELLEAAAELDRAGDALESARFDAIQAAAHERDAEAALARERAAATERAAAAERAEEERAAAARRAATRAAAPSPSTTAQPAPTPAPPATAAAPAPSVAPVTAAPAPPAPAPPAGMGNPSAAESATLAKIRRCESGGNYSIVSASGRYRGAYQFDYATWQGVGGSGDPAAASPAEQDYRALLLLRMRGTRPWPHCGR